MQKDKLSIMLKDTTVEVREMKEIQEMLTEISETVDKYGFEVRSVDCGITVILPGRIRHISIGDIKFPVDQTSNFQLTLDD